MKLVGKLAVVFFALVILLSACGNPSTGIQGKVVLGNCTGEQIATDCTGGSVFSASITIYNDKLVKLKTYRTKGDGSFLIALKPGTFYIHPEPPTAGKFPMAADFKVVVTKGKLTDLTIYYDTGVREGPPAAP